MYVTNETVFHLLIPLAYNRLMKQRKQGAPVHGAGTEAEIHRIAIDFPTNYFNIPSVHEVVDSKSYIMDTVFEHEGQIQSTLTYTHPTQIWEELIAFRNYLIREGYYPHGFTILLTNTKPKLFDFCNFGIIDKGVVRFPNGDTMSLQQAFEERPICHRVAAYVCGKEIAMHHDDQPVILD